ncbi:MAG: PhzF family phenazine biosynthesis protein [Anaerolineae bacterium]|nr:PhzF family phenazine biosynthesis protein [Anaerolineae bacterium]
MLVAGLLRKHRLRTQDVRNGLRTYSVPVEVRHYSRFFAPRVGINEDPVTGSAHTLLTPYWAAQLGKTAMLAYQASARGGEIGVRLAENDRVELTGDAVVVFKGELYV